jgi:hypothetical protein
VPSSKKRFPRRSSNGKKTELTVAIARGVSARKWAIDHNVPPRTAQRWASEPAVRAEVERMRRSVLDQAIGVLTGHVTSASKGIIKLAKSAVSESVRLSAMRAVLSDMIAASKFGNLEDRMTEIEEQLDERIGNPHG